VATRLECDDYVVGNHGRLWNGREEVHLSCAAACALAFTNFDTITVTVAFPVADPATIAFADSVTIAATVGKTHGHSKANANSDAETHAHAKADTDSEANADAQTNCHTKADRHSAVEANSDADT
jgi:hypothetical protein